MKKLFELFVELIFWTAIFSSPFFTKRCPWPDDLYLK